MGPTTLLDLSRDDRASVIRWHRREWEQFVAEVQAYKNRVLVESTDAYRRLYDSARKCEKCKKRRRAIMRAVQAFKGPRSQRGSIILSAFRGAVGSGDCSYTASTIPNLNDFTFSPNDAWTHARLHSDGDWYSNEGSSGWGASDGTWDGDCAIADYDTRWNNNSGDTSNNNTSGIDGTWSAATTSKAVGYFATNPADLFVGTFDLECRDGTTLTLLFTDAFSMSCEQEPKN